MEKRRQSTDYQKIACLHPCSICECATIILMKLQSYIIFLIFPNRELFLIVIIQNVPTPWHFVDKMNVFLAFNCYFCPSAQRLGIRLRRTVIGTAMSILIPNHPFEEHHAQHHLADIRPYHANGNPHANHSLVGRQRQHQSSSLQWQEGKPRHDCHQEEGGARHPGRCEKSALLAMD